MNATSPALVPDRAHLRHVTGLLTAAERPLRVLSSISWPLETRARFFERGARELPVAPITPFDADPTLRAIDAARREITDDGVVGAWIRRQADALERTARMLAAVGTPEFHAHSRRLYGAPRDELDECDTTPLALATALEQTVANLSHVDLGAPPAACHLAEHVAERMRESVSAAFGAMAPVVVVVDDLSANALAGPKAIRIRRQACFSDLDIEQLIHHEAHIHVGTSLNGRLQEDLPILGAGHGGTTNTQEGLAVFAEFITGTMDIDRLGRLAARVLAIRMAEDGADFLDVYRWFRDRGVDEIQSFESARRVFRGGVVTGGAPFTKDTAYLGGLLRVSSFMRAAVASGRADCLRLLFCGRLDLEDMPALCTLAAAGLCRPPRFLPAWAGDLRHLLAQLGYAAFSQGIDPAPTLRHMESLMASAPRAT